MPKLLRKANKETCNQRSSLTLLEKTGVRFDFPFFLIETNISLMRGKFQKNGRSAVLPSPSATKGKYNELLLVVFIEKDA